MPAEPRWYDRVVERSADAAVAAMSVPLRVLDVGCGTGALPFADGAFDLVVSTTSLHHWSDPRRGLVELHRVVAPHGKVVLVDLCAGPLRRTPDGTLVAKEVAALLGGAGLHPQSSETLYRAFWTLPLVRAFVAARS